MSNPLRDALENKLTKTGSSGDWVPMRLGLLDGTVAVGDSAPYYVWVIPFGGTPEKVLNMMRVPNTPGCMVRVGYDKNSSFPTRKQVLGVWDVYPDPQVENTSSHADQHQWGAWDTDWLQGERLAWQHILPVRGQQKVDLYPYTVQVQTGIFSSPNRTRIDFSAHIPASGVRRSFIVLTSAGAIAFRDGPVADFRENLTDSDWPTITNGDHVFGGLYLTAGMVDAKHLPGNDDIIDMRLSGAIGGGGSISSNLTVEEADGTPSVENVKKIIVPNGSLTAGTEEATLAFVASAITGQVAIANGGTGEQTAQAAIDALTQSSGADDGAVWTAQAGSGRWYTPNPSYIVVHEDLTDQIDGVTDTFTLPVQAESVMVSCGLRRRPSQVQISIDGTAITLDFVPSAPDILIVDMVVNLEKLLLDSIGQPIYDSLGEPIYA